MGTDVASLHAVDNSFSEMENTNGWDMGFDDFEGFSGHPEPENPIESHKSPPLLEKSACFERTPTLLSSHRARREVYKMPKEKEHEDTHILLWPIGIMLNLLGFQFKMLGYTMSAAALLLSICFSLLTEPIHRTVEAKNKVTGKISYGISVVTHSRMILWEAASEVGPVLNRLAKRVSYGVLAAAYAFVVVNSLIVPAVLIDYLVVSRLVEEPVHIKESAHFDYTEPRPSARVPLLPQATGITSMTPWSIPKTHSFHITATLTLPESDHNIRLGMFQVTAEILSVNGQVLARFTHPCMLRYQSSPVRYAKTAMLAVPLMLGVDVESQTLVLKLVESYEEKGSSSYPGSAKIILEPRAGFGPGAGLPEIYDARVLVQSKLPPFKAVLYRWKWTCYVWGAVFIFL